MINKTDAVKRLRQSGEAGLVLFLGAGISVEAPSSCPAWSQLLSMVVSAVEETHPRAAKLRSRLGSALSRIKPEMFCQTLYENLQVDGFFGFLDVLYMGTPNRNHVGIGELMRKFHIPLILTTNFDINIETALRQAGVEHELHVGKCPRKTLNNLRKHSPINHPVPVIKIHGSLEERSSIVITMRQAGHSLQRDLAETITWALTSSPILIVGYSGNDDDIFPVMLNVAGQTREVYWALWDNENSLTPKIEIFKNACPNCTLVGCDRQPILVELARESMETISDQRHESMQNQADYLRRWMSGTAESCWLNIFSELLLKTHCTEDAARAIVTETDAVRCTASDKWVLARSYANRGLAMAKLNDFDGCVKSLFEAADNFMLLAHHREVVECLSSIVTETPLRLDWNGKSIPQWCADIAGRNYDPYQLGIYHMVAGIVFFEQKNDQKKMAYAREHLFVAAGYARKCGDSILLIKCLENLSRFFRLTNCSKEERQCAAEVKLIKYLLGVSPLSAIVSEGSILQECDSAARRNLRQSILGEAVIVFVIAAILGSLAMLFVSDPLQRIFNFVILCISGAGIKIWNAKKASVKYRYIDRS